MSSIATVVAIIGKMQTAHDNDVERARTEVKAKIGEGQGKVTQEEADKQLAQVDMMDFQGSHAIEQLMLQTMSQVQKKEDETSAAIARNI